MDFFMFDKIYTRFLGLFIYCIIIPFFLIISLPSHAIESDVSTHPHISVSLVSEDSHLIKGQTHRIALKLQPDDGWHTYWKNPGDTGQPTTMEWNLPEGFIAGEIDWPIPERIKYRGLVNYGYHGTIFLPVNLSVPSFFDSDNVNIKVHVSWLVCEDICIPGEASLQINLPLSNSKDFNVRTNIFEKFSKDIPKLLYSNEAFYTYQDDIEVYIPKDSLPNLDIEPDVFIGLDGIIDNQSLPVFDLINEKIVINLKSDPYIENLPKFLPLTLVYPSDLEIDPRSFQLSASYEEIISSNDGIDNLTSTVSNYHIFNVILLAFFAGIILNAMPCVFPVLSLKIFSLIDNVNETRQVRYQHALAYTLGIIFSFLLIALILIALKSAGQQIGWGFQLQQPMFIALLAYVIFILALSLSGFFEFGGSFQNIGNKLVTNSTGWTSSFFTGVLATVVATPCTAPFMGVAIAYALSQTILIALIIFIVMGLGLALPFLLISFIPSISQFLPKPGKWMESLKQFLAFPLYITVVWLLWVFAKQTSFDSASLLLLGIVIVAMSIWFWMLSNNYEKNKLKILSFIIFLIAIFLAISASNNNNKNSDALKVSQNFTYEIFSQELLDKYLENNERVFVNMTADWCLTCKLNERIALSTNRVKNLFKDNQIRYLVGDWTNSDPLITEYLNKFEREGVPLYTYYTNNDEVKILPQLLTPGIIERAVELD